MNKIDGASSEDGEGMFEIKNLCYSCMKLLGFVIRRSQRQTERGGLLDDSSFVCRLSNECDVSAE